jgi:hypothetical protein
MYSNDTQTIESTISSVFDVISGTPGKNRDWNRFRNLFVSTAQFIVAPTNKSSGKNNLIVRNIDEVIESQSKWFKSNPLFENCVFQIKEEFRHLAHVLCTYESKKNKDELYGRGISSFQLMNDGERWWIVNWFWLGAGDQKSIPKKYLPSN